MRFGGDKKKDHYVNPLLKVSSYITGFLTNMFLFPGKYLYDKMRYPWQYHNLKLSKSKLGPYLHFYKTTQIFFGEYNFYIVLAEMHSPIYWFMKFACFLYFSTANFAH